jgi:hypothetical protein
MKWKPFNSGTPYTCKDCPAYAELQAERDRLVRLLDSIAVSAHYCGCVYCDEKIHSQRTQLLEEWEQLLEEREEVRGD